MILKTMNIEDLADNKNQDKLLAEIVEATDFRDYFKNGRFMWLSRSPIGFISSSMLPRAFVDVAGNGRKGIKLLYKNKSARISKLPSGKLLCVHNKTFNDKFLRLLKSKYKSDMLFTNSTIGYMAVVGVPDYEYILPKEYVEIDAALLFSQPINFNTMSFRLNNRVIPTAIVTHGDDRTKLALFKVNDGQINMFTALNQLAYSLGNNHTFRSSGLAFGIISLNIQQNAVQIGFGMVGVSEFSGRRVNGSFQIRYDDIKDFPNGDKGVQRLRSMLETEVKKLVPSFKNAVDTTQNATFTVGVGGGVPY